MQIAYLSSNKSGAWFPLTLCMLLIIPLVACEKQKAALPAPLNNVSSLEELAAAYEELSEQIPTSPVNLAPKARKKFVVQVFEKAGYGYSEPLQSLAKVNRSEVTKFHRDMQELLFLPHYGLQNQIKQEIYDEQQQQAIKLIENNFR